jgi:hypothetical protein
MWAAPPKHFINLQIIEFELFHFWHAKNLQTFVQITCQIVIHCGARSRPPSCQSEGTNAPRARYGRSLLALA